MAQVFKYTYKYIYVCVLKCILQSLQGAILHLGVEIMEAAPDHYVRARMVHRGDLVPQDLWNTWALLSVGYP
jgi:hypothetical protein